MARHYGKLSPTKNSDHSGSAAVMAVRSFFEKYID